MGDVEDGEEDEEGEEENVECYAAAFGGQGTVFAAEDMAPVDGFAFVVVFTHGVIFFYGLS